LAPVVALAMVGAKSLQAAAQIFGDGSLVREGIGGWLRGEKEQSARPHQRSNLSGQVERHDNSACCCLVVVMALSATMMSSSFSKQNFETIQCPKMNREDRG